MVYNTSNGKDCAGNKLPYLLHPNEAAIIEWFRRNPYGRLNSICAQDGVPTHAYAPTADGLGETSISLSRVALTYGLR